MNWLETHLREFVFPQLLQYRKENAAPFTTSGRLFAPLEPFTGKINPASGCMYTEMGMLKAFIKSIGLWERLVTKSQLNLYSYDRYKNWGPLFDSNFKKFNVRNISFDGNHKLVVPPTMFKFSENQILHTLLKNSVRSLRAQKKRVIFLGRDVWAWYVVAQQLGLDAVFDPRVSRNVAVYDTAVRQVCEELGLKEGDLIFDTGFAGTIPRLFRAYTRINFESVLLSSGTGLTYVSQQFPSAKLARNRALFIEYLPKYFQSGRVVNGEIQQPMASLAEFVMAALLTIWTYKYISPNWIAPPAYLKDAAPRPGLSIKEALNSVSMFNH
jgi:hypothetical protein